MFIPIKNDEVAKNVRVLINPNYQTKSLLEKDFLESKGPFYIREKHIYNDAFGEYVWVKSESYELSTIFYLKDLSLEFKPKEY